MSVMTSPIKIMRQFMQKPWPLFSCSPQCGIVNWIYVSRTGKMYPINRFVNFDRFFSAIRKTAETAETKNKFQLLSSLFMASMISMNMLLVTEEVGTFTLIKSILKMHMSPNTVAGQNPPPHLPAWLHGIHGLIQLRRQPRPTLRRPLHYTRQKNHSILRLQQHPQSSHRKRLR